MADTMRANVEEKTGKPMAHWLAVLRDAGFEKHGEMVKHLKTEFGIGHGFANLIAHDFRSAGETSGEDPVDEHYTGKKAHLRPIYDAVAKLVTALGPDVEFSPKKTYVSLRRSKQFATVGPATNSAVEVGLNLKGHPTTDRLLAGTGMVTHRVRLGAPAEADGELEGWLRKAYEAA
jgi:predicted transport protein